jgi:hypothetical protein
MLLCTITILVSHTCNADFISLSGHIQCLGCDSSNSEARASLWGEPVQGVRLSLGISNTARLVGESIVASATMSNITDRPIDFPLDSTLRVFGLSVVSVDGATVPLTDYGRRMSQGTPTAINEERLSPQKVLIMGYDLGRAFDMTKPGKYLVTARYRIPKPKDTNMAYVVSNTVTIGVAAASSEEPKEK